MTQTMKSDVSALMLGRGWRRVREGLDGAADLWMLPETVHEMYLPSALRRGSFEWSDIMDRLASAHHQQAEDVERAVSLVRFDVTRFRVDSDRAGGGSIALEAGATVIGTAFGMLRAAATTARRPRQAIGSNYSKLGDGIAREARLGHTEEGSFVFPILMELSGPKQVVHTPLPGADVDSVVPESEERRVMRTLAQTIAVFEERIIRPAVDPTASDLMPVIIAGGSKEVFVQMQRTLAEPNVAWLETSFAWAPVEPRVSSIPERVIIPSDARDLISQTVRILAEPKRYQLRVLTGPIIQITHKPGDPFGEIAIQTPSPTGARVGRVEARVRSERLSELHHWMDTGTTVVVQGVVERLPGRAAQLREVARPVALSDTVLVDPAAVES